MLKLFAYLPKSPNWRRPLYAFSKRDERIQKKIQEVEQLSSTQRFESVADQKDLTDEQLVWLVEERKEFIRKLQQEVTIPKQAIYVGIATLAPLYLLMGGTFYCGSEMIGYSYLAMHATLKYAAINIAFQAGIHWGFAMSMHECQLDWQNSSKDARRHFLFATLPILGSILLAHFFLYGDYDEVKVTKAIILLMLLNIGVMFLDLRARRHSPGWYLKSKVLYGMGLHFGLAPILLANFGKKNEWKQLPNVYRIVKQ